MTSKQKNSILSIPFCKNLTGMEICFTKLITHSELCVNVTMLLIDIRDLANSGVIDHCHYQQDSDERLNWTIKVLTDYETISFLVN